MQAVGFKFQRHIFQSHLSHLRDITTQISRLDMRKSPGTRNASSPYSLENPNCPYSLTWPEGTALAVSREDVAAFLRVEGESGAPGSELQEFEIKARLTWRAIYIYIYSYIIYIYIYIIYSYIYYIVIYIYIYILLLSAFVDLLSGESIFVAFARLLGTGYRIRREVLWHAASKLYSIVTIVV